MKELNLTERSPWAIRETGQFCVRRNDLPEADGLHRVPIEWTEVFPSSTATACSEVSMKIPAR